MRNINIITSKYFHDNLKSKIKQNLNKIISKFDIEQKHFLKFYFFSIALLILRISPYFICNLTIFIFPFLESNKLLQEDKLSDNDKKWILYWSMYGFGILVDEIILLILEVFPYYFLMKFFIFTWLGLPNFDGVNYILENYYFDITNQIKNLIFKNVVNKKTICSDLDKYLEKNNNDLSNYFLNGNISDGEDSKQKKLF